MVMITKGNERNSRKRKRKTTILNPTSVHDLDLLLNTSFIFLHHLKLKSPSSHYVFLFLTSFTFHFQQSELLIFFLDEFAQLLYET